MANGSIPISQFVSQGWGSQGVPAEQQAAIVSQLQRYFPSGQIPTAQAGQVMQLFGVANPGFGAQGASGESTVAQNMLQFLGSQPSQATTATAASAGGGWDGGGFAGGGGGMSYLPVSQGGFYGAGGLLGGGTTTMATQPGATLSTSAAQIPTNVGTPAYQAWYNANQGKTILVAGKPRTIGVDINNFGIRSALQGGLVSWGKYTTPGGQAGQNAPTYFGAGATAQAPESVALQQMGQIDPASEALRQQLAGSFATPLSQAQQPSAATLQSYLDMYGQLDPQSYATMQALGQQVGGNLALGSTLDPSTQREVEQATRAAQGARGNVYGTPQMVAEAMTRGQAGLQLQQQRQQAAQSYLASGLTPASTALNLYQQNLANLRGAQQGAQSYLGSGQTPYQAGAGYLANAQQAGAAASQGFSVGQPAGLAPSYSYLNPAYGQQTSQTALGYYNQMANLYGTQLAYGGQKSGGLGSALGGAVSGAASGAALGSIIPGVGTVIGGVAGGLLGGVGGYFG